MTPDPASGSLSYCFCGEYTKTYPFGAGRTHPRLPRLSSATPTTPPSPRRGARPGPPEEEGRKVPSGPGDGASVTPDRLRWDVDPGHPSSPRCLLGADGETRLGRPCPGTAPLYVLPYLCLTLTAEDSVVTGPSNTHSYYRPTFTCSGLDTRVQPRRSTHDPTSTVVGGRQPTPKLQQSSSSCPGPKPRTHVTVSPAGPTRELRLVSHD